MSYYQDIFDITIRGKKSNVIRMLNAAIRNVGTGAIIVDDDDIETINKKIKDEDGQHGLQVACLDLIDEQGLENPALQVKKHEFEVNNEEYGEEVYDGRIIDILDVSERNDEYEVKLEYYIGEETCDLISDDWADWSDIARQYGCFIVIGDYEFCNGSSNGVCSVTVYKPENGEISMTRITPDDNLHDIQAAFDKLIPLDSEKFRQIKIRFLEKGIRNMRYELSVEKLKATMDHVAENDGHVVIPDGLSDIPACIFQNCKELKSVEIPEGIEHIGTLAFAGCKNLKSISLPASLKDFHLSAFNGCCLESIEVHPDNGNFCSEGNCILSKDKKTLILGCKTSAIPASVTLIGEQAFSDNPCSEEIVIPGTVKRVESYAFSHCSGLKRVVISEGVEELGFLTFGYCPELESVSFPENMNFIGSCVFQGSPCLEELQARYPELFEEIPKTGTVKECNDEECPDRTFENPLIDENGHAVIPEGATEIEECQFEYCRRLVSIDIPNSVTAIRLGAFLGCTGLTKIVIPESVKEIEQFAFKGCTSLTDIVIPDGVNIVWEAFDGCPCEKDLKERLGLFFLPF